MLDKSLESFPRLPNISFLLFLLLWNSSPSSSFCPPLCSCNDNSLSVDCQEAGNLRMVPIFLNPQTKFLSLARNQIKDVSMSFQFYSELQQLDFSQNKIVSIGENNFENLKNVRKLNVSFNGINELEADVFLGLSKTLVLDLSANQLEKIHTRVFKNMESLRELYLDRNRLDSLDWDLFQGLENLETLSAKYNFLRVLQPPTTSTVTAAMSTTSWTLKNVQRLDMSWNQITRIKDHGLSVFNSLLDLNLCCNYIHTIEERAFVPSPAGVLTKVNLSQNRLSRVPTESLEKLGSSLQQLDLSSNRISDKIQAHSFRSLFQLRILRLSDNPGISSIDPDALNQNTNLVEFEADHLSNLTELHIGLFNNKPFLRNFSIRFSQVSIVPMELLQNPKYSGLISTLRFVGNPLDCNCSSFPLFQYISASSTTTASSSSSSSAQMKLKSPSLNINKSFPHDVQLQLLEETSASASDTSPPSLGHVQCASPPHLHGALLQDLRLSDFEHCFERVFFASEHFEILVIGIGAVIVVAILTLIGVKLCCIRGICRRNRGLFGGSCCRKQKHSDDKDEKDRALDDFCCAIAANGNSNGTIHHDRDLDLEYPTIVAAKKGFNCTLNSETEFRIPIIPSHPSRGRVVNGNGNFGTIGGYSNGINCHSNSHSSISVPMTLTSGSSGKTNLTLTGSSVNGSAGTGSPGPLDLDGYLHLHSSLLSAAEANKSNKLRFDPKMHNMMEPDNDILFDEHQHHRRHHNNHLQANPPMILHYEYDYPDPRYNTNTNTNRSTHRVKQVPSVLV